MDKDKKEQINNIMSLVKLCSLLFAGSIVIKDIFFNPEMSYSIFVIISVIACILLPTFYFIWNLWQKRKNGHALNSSFQFVESLCYVIIFCFMILVSGAAQSDYKFLLLLIIVSATIQMGMSEGLYIAFVSSASVLIIDLITSSSASGITIQLENDVILCGIFILVAWTLGFYVKVEGQYIRQLEHWLNVDILTDIYNYRYFRNAFNEKITKAKKEGSQLAFMLLDIDFFKNYNDLNGHQKGDVVLKTIASILMESKRGEDIVARYSGEEFVILMPDVTEEEALKIGEDIRLKVENAYFENQEYQPNGNLTISIGISLFPDKAKDEDELIRSADDALYRAKFFSKNRVESYTSILDELKNDIEDKDIDLITSIKTLIMVINIKDRYTYGHTERVVIYSKMLADELKLADADRKNLIYAAYMHDIGKIDTPKLMLNKPGVLTSEEWEILQQHPVKGAELISPVDSLGEIIPLIRHHHERYDGAGYPDNLAGEDIPYLARALTVVDCFDAMMSNRPYQRRRPYEDAIEELKNCKGMQFDPQMVDAFIRALDRNR